MDKETFGRYVIKAKLGQGGMGSVYHAYDPNFKREVALKLLDRRFSHNKSFRHRFEREARAVARIDHPRIVPIYDYGEDEGRMFLVMPLMEGGTLKDKMAGKPLSVAEAVDILRQIAPALTVTHEMGMVHRDLKPDNILFDQFGNAYVSDFGIVKQAGGETNLTAGGLIGTPAYMSPEQAKGHKELDGRSDIYSLGVILFEMLTGKRPYEAENSLAIALKHLTQPIPSILAVRPDLPVGLEYVINKTMQKEPEKRYQTVADLVADLENIDHFPLFDSVETPPPPSDVTELLPPPVLEPPPRRRWLLPALAIGALLIGGGLVGGTMLMANGRAAPTATTTTIAVLPSSTTTPTDTAVPSQTPTEEPSATPASTSTPIPSPSATPPAEIAVPESTPTVVLVPQRISRENLSDLQEWLTIPNNTDQLRHVALSPDEQWAAVASDQGVRLYQLPDFSPGDFVIEGAISQLDWSPDGRHLATSGPDSRIRIWDTADWSETATIPGAAAALAWHPDGQQLLWGAANGVISLWPVSETEAAQTWADHTSAITDLAWSPDGVLFASASSDNNIYIRNLTETRPVRTSFRQNGVWNLAWSPDGSQLATAGADGSVRLEEIAGGQPRSLNCSGGQPRTLVWLDDATIATGSEDGRIRICPVNGRAPSLTMGNHGGVQQVFWLPGSGQLLSVGERDDTLQLWQASDGVPGPALVDYASYALATVVQWSPDGTKLAIGSQKGIVLIWSLATQQIESVLGGHDAEVVSLAWSPDGRYLATSGGAAPVIHVNDVPAGAVIQTITTHTDRITAVSWGADSNQLASAGYDSRLQIWDLTEAEVVESWTMQALGRVLAAAWSPDGQEIVTGGQTSLVQLRPPQRTRLTVTLNEHDAPVRAAAWASDSQSFATADNNGRVLLWPTAVADNGAPTLEINLGVSVRDLAWSPDNSLLTALTATTVKFLDTASGETVSTLQNLHGFSGNIAWSQDGQRLAGVNSDGAVQLWHVLAEAASD